MDSPVTKLIFIAAAVAASVLVVAVMWATLSDNAPQSTDGDVEFDRITDQSLCQLVGGTWTTGNPGSCG